MSVCVCAIRIQQALGSFEQGFSIRPRCKLALRIVVSHDKPSRGSVRVFLLCFSFAFGGDHRPAR